MWHRCTFYNNTRIQLGQQYVAFDFGLCMLFYQMPDHVKKDLVDYTPTIQERNRCIERLKIAKKIYGKPIDKFIEFAENGFVKEQIEMEETK